MAFLPGRAEMCKIHWQCARSSRGFLEHYGRARCGWYPLATITFGDDGDLSQQQRFSIWSTTTLAIRSATCFNRNHLNARRWFDNAVPPSRPGIHGATHPLAAAAATARELVPAGMERLDFRQAAEARCKLAIDPLTGYLNGTGALDADQNQGGRVRLQAWPMISSSFWRPAGMWPCFLAPLLPDLLRKEC